MDSRKSFLNGMRRVGNKLYRDGKLWRVLEAVFLSDDDREEIYSIHEFQRRRVAKEIWGREYDERFSRGRPGSSSEERDGWRIFGLMCQRAGAIALGASEPEKWRDIPGGKDLCLAGRYGHLEVRGSSYWTLHFYDTDAGKEEIPFVLVVEDTEAVLFYVVGWCWGWEIIGKGKRNEKFGSWEIPFESTRPISELFE